LTCDAVGATFTAGLDFSSPLVRIVVDTNVFISAALAIKHRRFDSPSFRIFEVLFHEKGAESVVSAPTLYELADKLRERRFDLSAPFIVDFVELVGEASTVVPIRGLAYPCRDPNDCKFIETAVNGRVDFLVTHDRDLADPVASRELAKRGCAVVTATQFLAVSDVARHPALQKPVNET
jgi:putative PIN family toxin of toxin-antitoxin system